MTANAISGQEFDTQARKSHSMNVSSGPRKIQERILLDLRAQQRTSAGYYRSAVAQLTFALIILKLFEPRFWTVGFIYTLYAIILLLLGQTRNKQGRANYVNHNGQIFTTCGDVVILTTVLSLVMNITLLGLSLQK